MADRKPRLSLFEEEDTADADFGDKVSPGDISAEGATDHVQASASANPPASEGNEPPDLADLRIWGETERTRLVALTDMDEVIIGGKKMQDDKRWRRLKAYDQADAQRIVRSIRNRIDELEAG